MRRRTLLLVILSVLTAWAALWPITAQDGIDTGVWVTTQDRSSLRSGPGTHWERLTIIPPAVTLPAIGRTSDARWVQVVHEGQIGWIAYWLLVWSGDLLELPIDANMGQAYVRQQGIEAITTRETPIYREEIDPSTEVGRLPAETPVELTGRLGGGPGFFRYQIMWNGQLYWAGSWNLRIIDGGGRLLDKSYLYAYGRLTTQVSRDVSTGESRLRSIENQWLTLQDGGTIRCDRVPEFLGVRGTTDSDIRAEPIFGPAITALDTAYGHTNNAIGVLEDACNRDDAYITQDDVTAAINEINSARRNYNLARSLLISLDRREPF